MAFLPEPEDGCCSFEVRLPAIKNIRNGMMCFQSENIMTIPPIFPAAKVPLLVSQFNLLTISSINVVPVNKVKSFTKL